LKFRILSTDLQSIVIDMLSRSR